MKKLLKNEVFGLIAVVIIVGICAIGVQMVRAGFGITTSITSNTAGEAVFIAGSQTGTTTAQVDFSNDASTTTLPFNLGADKNSVSLYFKTASSTLTNGSEVAFNLLASNDWGCDTATTSTIYNVPTEDQINWYDIGNHLRGLSGSLTPAVGTTTIAWTIGEQEQNKVFTFTDLNAKCLALDLWASSTAVYVQAMMK